MPPLLPVPALYLQFSHAEVMMKNMKVAAIQMNSCDSVSDNLILAAKLVTQAAQRGAIFVLLPEYFYFMGTTDESRVMLGERN